MRALRITILSKNYCISNTTIVQLAKENKIEVLIPDPHFRTQDERFKERPGYATENNKKYEANDFIFNEDDNTYTCPWGKLLT
ncbi:hypothetical protein [Treponema primitia]|uniref:hypothetical protein n=1 Tax=Treponema primitia TaxID=88058 RepID=UPI0002F50C4B|nr:hypothetical protein [Treponema primitia]